ncbi:hypothetical protein [Acinetobacter sp.]|uniref:hypothetical protein n=1 Tax=Acinetobacter sp. TaxID=472 RepID=UPI0035AEF2CF
MKKYIFFDKRYFNPISFNGSLFHEATISGKNLQIFFNDKKKYVVVYQASNNTEIYVEEDLFSLIKYFESDINSLLNLMENKNYELIDEYHTRASIETPYFSENYSIYLYKINTEDEIFIIKTKNKLLYSRNNFLSPNQIMISEWVLKKIKNLKFSKTSSFLGTSIRSKYHTNDNNIKYLNLNTDGSRSYDTRICSIEDKKNIYLYGDSIEFLKDDEDDYYCLITSKKYYFLIINDKIYRDIHLPRLLLLLPDNIYKNFFKKFNLNFDEKFHFFAEKDYEKSHNKFKTKKYKEINLPLNLDLSSENLGYSDRKSFSSEILTNDYFLEFKSLNNWYSPDGAIIDKKISEIYKDYQASILTESFPILTDGEVLIEKGFVAQRLER